MRPLQVLVPLLLAGMALAGCAKSIDDAKAEKFIAKTVAEQVGAKVKSVSCPSGLEARKGETFECTVTAEDGTRGTTKVTEKDDQGNVEVNAPFIHVDELEQTVSDGISQQVGGSVALDCPEIIEAAKGDTFDCSVSAGSDKATVAVTQTDDQGHVQYKLSP